MAPDIGLSLRVRELKEQGFKVQEVMVHEVVNPITGKVEAEYKVV